MSTDYNFNKINKMIIKVQKGDFSKELKRMAKTAYSILEQSGYKKISVKQHIFLDNFIDIVENYKLYMDIKILLNEYYDELIKDSEGIVL